MISGNMIKYLLLIIYMWRFFLIGVDTTNDFSKMVKNYVVIFLMNIVNLIMLYLNILIRLNNILYIL